MEQSRYSQEALLLYRGHPYLCRLLLLDPLQRDNLFFDYLHHILLRFLGQYMLDFPLVYIVIDSAYLQLVDKLFEVCLAFQRQLDLLETYRRLKKFSLW